MKLNKIISRSLILSLFIFNLNNLAFANIDIPNRYETLEGEYITIDDSTEGNLEEIEIFGNTIQDPNNLEDIQSVGDLYVDESGNPILDKQGKEQYKVNLGSKNKSLIDLKQYYKSEIMIIDGRNVLECNDFNKIRHLDIKFKPNTQYTVSFDFMREDAYGVLTVLFKYSDGTTSYGARNHIDGWQSHSVTSAKNKTIVSARIYNASNGGHTGYLDLDTFMIEEGSNSSSYVKSECFESTILLPTQLQKAGDVADKLYWDSNKGRYVVEKNIDSAIFNGSENWSRSIFDTNDTVLFFMRHDGTPKYASPYISNSEIPYVKLDAYPGVVDYEFVFVGEDFNIRINKDKLDNDNVESFVKYLKQNPLKIYYQLKAPKIIEINIVSKLKIPTYDEKTHIYVDSQNNVNPTLKVTVDRLPQIAKNSVEEARINSDTNNISLARMYVNMLPESLYKDQLHEQLNQIFSSDITLDRELASSNLDIYVKSENMLSMSLNTNSITFDGYSGTEDTEMLSAVNISINSSLPYSLNAYLPSEIANSDKSETMTIDILNIKESSESNYQTFANTTDKIVLKDNCNAGNDLVHNIDLKLASNLAHKADVYKTVIKFEAEQK